jgi:hypothetical protein
MNNIEIIIINLWIKIEIFIIIVIYLQHVEHNNTMDYIFDSIGDKCVEDLCVWELLYIVPFVIIPFLVVPLKYEI